MTEKLCERGWKNPRLEWPEPAGAANAFERGQERPNQVTIARDGRTGQEASARVAGFGELLARHQVLPASTILTQPL